MKENIDGINVNVQLFEHDYDQRDLLMITPKDSGETIYILFNHDGSIIHQWTDTKDIIDNRFK